MSDKKLGHSTHMNGSPASSDRNSLTVGSNGPIVLPKCAESLVV